MYCHVYQWLKTGHGLVIEFINHLQVVITINCYTTSDLHNLQSLHTNLIYFHCSSLSVSWQRIYNTGNIKVPVNYTFSVSMYYSTCDVTISLLILLLTTLLFPWNFGTQVRSTYYSILQLTTARKRPLLSPTNLGADLQKTSRGLYLPLCDITA
jgi:hypothetical protein